jgi:hypothetical protein
MEAVQVAILIEHSMLVGHWIFKDEWLRLRCLDRLSMPDSKEQEQTPLEPMVQPVA